MPGLVVAWAEPTSLRTVKTAQHRGFDRRITLPGNQPHPPRSRRCRRCVKTSSS
jgi:ribosomal protein L40E